MGEGPVEGVPQTSYVSPAPSAGRVLPGYMQILHRWSGVTRVKQDYCGLPLRGDTITQGLQGTSPRQKPPGLSGTGIGTMVGKIKGIFSDFLPAMSKFSLIWVQTNKQTNFLSHCRFIAYISFRFRFRFYCILPTEGTRCRRLL